MAPENPPCMRISLVLRASIVALALVGWAATPALAAPQMISSDPEEGAELHQPPARVRITVSEPLTGESNIKVTDDCGTIVSVGKAEVGGTADNELSIAIGKAPHHGTYLVQWYGTGVTGTGSGQFTFTVHAGTGCDGGGGGGHGGHGGGTGSGSGGGDGHGSGSGSGGHGSGSGSGSGGHGSGHAGGGSGSGSGHSTGHSGSGDDHSTMSGGGHSGGDHKMGGKHRSGHSKKNNKHGKHNMHGNGRHQGHQSGGGDDVFAGGPVGPISDIPTGTTVVIALGLAVLMGAAGGWVLRISTPR